MKKAYIKPEQTTVLLEHRTAFLAESDLDPNPYDPDNQKARPSLFSGNDDFIGE